MCVWAIIYNAPTTQAHTRHALHTKAEAPESKNGKASAVPLPARTFLWKAISVDSVACTPLLRLANAEEWVKKTTDKRAKIAAWSSILGLPFREAARHSPSMRVAAKNTKAE
jgi:hypothetical protein